MYLISSQKIYTSPPTHTRFPSFLVSSKSRKDQQSISNKSGKSSEDLPRVEYAPAFTHHLSHFLCFLSPCSIFFSAPPSAAFYHGFSFLAPPSIFARSRELEPRSETRRQSARWWGYRWPSTACRSIITTLDLHNRVWDEVGNLNLSRLIIPPPVHLFERFHLVYPIFRRFNWTSCS